MADETETIQESFVQFIPLVEKSVRADGTATIKIIQDGWGSSGYYPRDVLERDIPKVFPPGTHMYWNHATSSEEMERPERDLRDLAAVTIAPAQWLDGPAGAGMYTEARVFSGYAQTLDEIGDHIGVSIRGGGMSEPGEVGGRRGNIVREITRGDSIDYVTRPGAGGAIVKIFESAAGAALLPDIGKTDGKETAVSENQTEDIMGEQELQEAQDKITTLEAELAERDATLAKMRELLLLREARDFVAGLLAQANLPDMTKARLQRTLTVNPPMIDGKLDEADFKALVETAVAEAQAEIAAIAGGNSRITGMGAAATNGTPKLQETIERLDAALSGIGYGGNE